MLSIRSRDEQVIRKVLAGRTEEFGVLVERYLPVVHAVGCAHLGNAADAEDVAQETFLKAYQQLDALRERRKFAAWLASIARNACRNLRRSRARESERVREAASQAEAEAPDADREELRALVRSKVAELEEGPREILTLRYYADERVRDIARILGITEAAAKKRLQRARETLGEQLLQELQPALEPARSRKERAARIMGAVAAAPVPWATTTAVVTTGGVAAGGLTLLHKAIIGAVVVGTGALATLGVYTQAGKLGLRAETTQQQPESVALAESSVSPARPTDTREAADGRNARDTADSSDSDSQQASERAAGVTDPNRWAEGVVVCSVTDERGRPVSGAVVSIVNAYDAGVRRSIDAKPDLTAETDARGEVTFTGLLSGLRLVKAASRDRMAIGQAILERYEPKKKVSLQLERVGTIAGTVRNEAGQGVEGVEIRPDHQDESRRLRHGWNQYVCAKSADTGAFELGPIPASQWRLRVEAEGYASLRTEPFQVGERSAKITLTKGATVSGRVVEAKTGRAVPGVKVSTAGQEATSDAHGGFSFSLVPPGQHSIRVQDPVYAQLREQDGFKVRDGGSAEDVRVEVAKGGAISGRLYNAKTGESVRGSLEISLESRTASAHQSVEVDDTGRYRCGGLPRGEYEVRVGHAERFPYRVYGEPKAVAVEWGKEVSGVDFPLDPDLTVLISGRVLDMAGQPARGAKVSCSVGNSTSTGSTGEGGSFERKVRRGDQVALVAFTVDQVSNQVGPLNVTGKAIEDITLVLRPAASVSGKVVDGAGKPVADADLHLKSADGNAPRTTDMIRTDGAGRFEVGPLLPGTYSVMVVAHQPLSHGRPTPGDFTVAQGQRLEGLVLTMGGEDMGPLSITGRVRNARGEGIARARVRARPDRPSRGRPYMPEVTADARGQFEVTGLHSGSYHLSVSHNDYSGTSIERVAAGQRGLDIVLEERCAVEGTVVRADTGAPLGEFEVGWVRQWDGEASLSNMSFSRVFDVDGHFGFDNIEARGPREIAVVARAPGCAPGFAVARVTPGQTTPGVTVRLNPSMIISGTVVDSAGAPVAGAYLFVDEFPRQQQEPWLGQESAAQTDSSGAFSLDMLSPSASMLYAYHEDHAVTQHPVPRGTSAERVQIVLGDGGVVEGVVRAGAEPAPEQRVQLKYVQRGAPYEQLRGHVETDASGAYRFEKLAPGEVEVHVSLTRRSPSAQAGAVSVTQMGRAVRRRAIVAEGRTTEVDLEVPLGDATFEGRVTFYGAPPEHAMVCVEAEGPDGILLFQASVGADSAYRLEGVPAGHATAYYMAMDSERSRYGKREELDIKPGANRRDVELMGTGALDVTVTGAPAGRVYVLLLPGKVDANIDWQAEAERMQMTMTRQVILQGDGACRIEGLPAGAYTAMAATEGFRQRAFEYVDVPEAGEATVALHLE